jgi:hypothetical protein
MRYMKLYRLGRNHKYIDPTGTVRRIRALYALGWSGSEIGKRIGRSEEWTRHIESRTAVSTKTALTVADLYERLCMTIPDSPYAERVRDMARARGCLPPLAWDNIDDPNERPRVVAQRYTPSTDLDPIAVERAMAGDRVRLTRAERFEVVTRLRRQGVSFLEIEARTVITKPERYIVREEGAA